MVDLFGWWWYMFAEEDLEKMELMIKIGNNLIHRDFGAEEET